MADGNFGNVSATGNIVADGYISAAGNVTATGLLFASPTTANLSVGNIALYNNLNMTGSLSTSGNVTADRITGNLVSGNQPNITSIGTLSSLTVSGNTTSGNVLTSGIISSTGNATHGNVTTGIVSANTVLANTITFNSPTTSNIDVGNLALYSNLNMTGAISTSGNITGARFIGNLVTANQPNITNVGTLTSLSVSGNATSGNVLTSGIVSSTGNATHGNVTTGIVSANAVLTNTITFNSPTTANISVGNLALYSNLNMTGSVSAAGNIRGNYFLGNGYYLTGISGVASNYGNSNVAAYLPTYTGNLTANVISATGNITGSYILGNGSELTGITSSYGNANVVANIAALGSNPVSTTGNITGSYILGNGSQLTGLPAGYSNADVSTYLANSNVVISTTGNISGSYILGNGSQLTDLPASYSNADVSTYLANSNVVISTTGNITGNYFIGNGSQLTDLPASYSNADVSTYLANSNVVISTTGNITGSYILGNGSQLTGISGGNANIGNVTFDNINIIGTGNLHLQPDPTNSASFLDVFLTSGPDLHLVASNGANLILGEDTGANVLASWNGNVSVQSWNQSTGNLGGIWTFDTTGNLTLPANTFAVNYANGDPVTFSGGSGNTGNVTFDDNTVIGTGDEYGGSGLYLAPGANSIGNVQYLRVRGGDFPTHIHLDTGNNQYFDQYFGDDGKYVKLANTGNIEIRSDDATGNAAQWTFDTTGNLTLPSGGNLIVSGAIVSSGASPAPSLSGFSSVNAITFSASGNIIGGNISTGGTLTATGKIGYVSGSTVTQLTSRGTGVSINALAGTIITTSAAMVATEIDTFSVTNSSVDPNSDIVLAQIVSTNQGTYNCIANPAIIGGFNPGFFLNIVNISGFTTSDETITIRFMVIKAPNA